MKLEDFFADMKDIFNDDSADDFDQKVFDLIQEKTGESTENACEVLDSVITIAYKKLGVDPDLSIEAENEIEWLFEDFCEKKLLKNLTRQICRLLTCGFIRVRSQEVCLFCRNFLWTRQKN